MKTLLEQELKELQSAFKKGLLTTNEYCDAYYSISKKLKALK